MLFPVQRPGDYVRADFELHFFNIYFYYFLTKILKKIFAAAQLATILATRWTGNKLFLSVALYRNMFSYSSLPFRNVQLPIYV